jgi:hypothetical protein
MGCKNLWVAGINSMKKIKTTKVGRDFAESTWVRLEQTPETLVIFKPEIHPGGVRGFLVRYKKEHSADWSLLKDRDFAKAQLEPKTKVEVELTTEAVARLRQAIDERTKIIGLGIKSGNYVVAESDKVVVVDDATKRAIFDSLLRKGYTDEFWSLLRESEPELATRLSVGHIYAEKIDTLKELRRRLAAHYPETAGPTSWQRWIYDNNWLFGINYVRTIEKAKINISGGMPDYLFLTADNFADVLEIKLPSEEVIVEDKNHVGAYKWCPKTNEAIGQIVTYLSEIDRLQLELEREIKRMYDITVSFVKPRGFILIGMKEGWDQFKRDALRKLNFALHGIEVVTYTDLVQRGTEIAQMYKNELF